MSSQIQVLDRQGPVDGARSWPSVADRSWNASSGPGPGAYRSYPGSRRFTRVSRDGLVHAVEVDQGPGRLHPLEAAHDDGAPNPAEDPEEPQAVPCLPNNPAAPDAGSPLVSAVLVSEPPLVEATVLVSTTSSILRRFSDAGRRLFARKKKNARRPSAGSNPDGQQQGDASSSSLDDQESSGTISDLPGAYRVEPDVEDPDVEIVHAAPVQPSRAAVLRSLLRRLVRLRFQLGESRDVVEAEVQVIQRRIDGIEEGASPDVLAEEESPRIQEAESPWATPEDSSRSMDEEDAAAVVIVQVGRTLVEVDEAYARQFLSVRTKKGNRPDPDGGAAKRAAAAGKPMWGRPDDGDDSHNEGDVLPSVTGDFLPSVSDNGSAGSQASSAAEAPELSPPEHELQAAREVIQQVRDDLSEVQQKYHELEAAHAEGLRRVTDIEAELEAAQAEVRNVSEELGSVKEQLQAFIKEQKRLQQAHQAELLALRGELQVSIGAQQSLRQSHQAELRSVKDELQASIGEQASLHQAELESHQAEFRSLRSELSEELRSLKDELHTTIGELQGLKQSHQAELRSVQDDLQDLISEHQCLQESHQADLSTFKAECARSIAEVERELAEARSEQRHLNVKQGESERMLAEMALQLEAKHRLDAEALRLRERTAVEQGRKRRRILEVGDRCYECYSRSSKECSYPLSVNCGSEDSCSDTSDYDCSESPVSFYDDSSADGHDLSVISCEAQIWSEQDVREANAIREKLATREVLAIVNLEQDVTPEFSYPFRPDEVEWAEAVALARTWLLPSGAPSDMMGKLLIGILKTLLCCCGDEDFRLKHVACYRSSLVVVTDAALPDPSSKSPRMVPVEMLVALVDKASSLCVDTEAMTPESQRLIFCAKGFVGDGGQPIWRGGHDQVLSSIENTLSGMRVCPQEAVCPMCLQTMHPHKAATWNHDLVKSAASRSVNCGRGHRVDVKLICGPGCRFPEDSSNGAIPMRCDPVIANSPRSVVIVGVYNAFTRQWVEVGSGFVVDRKLGLILTAAHTVKEEPRYRDFPWRRRQYRIGLETDEGVEFLYVAEIAEDGPARVDACILRITGPVANARNQLPFLSDLQELSLASEWFMEENVRLVGYNQGGEGVFLPGTVLDRQRDVVRGYVCKLYESRINGCTREEIVVIGGQVIKGHSGGPCVNSRGEVLGLLSRADSYYGLRWYLVPFTKLLPLLERAQGRCKVDASAGSGLSTSW